MMGTPLVIDDEVRAQIKACIELAEANPVDMPALMERIKDPVKKEHHMAQMTRQSVKVPLAYMVTFSIEDGHPIGRCRHMSMSVQREGRLPNEIGVWMIAKEFGFWGSLKDCTVRLEDLQGHGKAVNIVQPVTKP
jgi:hypothetical protein